MEDGRGPAGAPQPPPGRPDFGSDVEVRWWDAESDGLRPPRHQAKAGVRLGRRRSRGRPRNTWVLFLGLMHFILLDVRVAAALGGATAGSPAAAPPHPRAQTERCPPRCASRGGRRALPENRVHFPKSGRFSRKFDPGAGAFESGFVPMADPYGGGGRAGGRQAPAEDAVFLVVEGRRGQEEEEGALGSGHFEVLGGGVFADAESNEIAGGGRRMGRGAGRPQRVLFPDRWRWPFRAGPPVFPRGASSGRR